ncbi:MAG TPA: M23 family metallopeptidase [Patescibacteria group bacterium]|nr:M23 family metallopeptidase [Patescibacteria group bacterium]
MLQFTSPRARLFRKRRFGLRHIVLSAAVLAAAYGLMPSREVAVAPAGPVLAASAPAESRAAAPSRGYEVLNLKDAFDAKPIAPNYPFAAEDSAGKPKVVIAAQPAPALQGQLSYIQSGITKILEASTDLKEILDKEKHVRVGKGDTLMELLVKNDVSRDEAYQAIQALRKVYDPRDLNPGHQVTVFFHKDPRIADPKFVGLRIERDTVNAVVLNRGDDGNFKVNEEAKTVHRQMKAYRAKIDSSLYVDAKQAGVPDNVILELIKMYSMGVDFQREIHNGDAFDVMYEQYVTDDGRVVPNKGEIVYARLALSDRTMPLYRFEGANGDVEYFDQSGQSVKKPLMKTPIDGARISSGFGFRRHPVLGYNKMHKGIDFAAPRGTPVYAAGDGVIQKAGRFSSYGNYVRIRHRSGVETAYAHLNGFKSGIKPGTRVKQGQVIAYVGTTGRSTGPHLHYEIMMGGKQVNPASVKLAGGNSLSGKALKTFKANVQKLDSSFAKALAPAPAVASVAAGTVARN